MHVAICCITLRRPEGLERLLDGINGLSFRKSREPKITVIVVDNDRDAPMRPLVEGRSGFRWRLRYDCEPIQGLATARNRALDLVPTDAEWIAFIDDDEVPEPGWLDELLYVARTYRAPIVQGPVRPMFVSPPPRWIVRGRFFEHGPFADGAALGYAATNNSMIAAAVVRHLRLRFDDRFDRTGGEDQRFFGCAIRAGYRVVTAENALVCEWIPKDRTTLRYLLKRRFRMGNTLTMTDRIDGGPGRLAVRAIKGIGRIGLGMIQAVSLAPRGASGLAAALCTIAWGTGSLAGLFGVAHREYARPGDDVAGGRAAVIAPKADALTRPPKPRE
jgi:succinoglycan biosynthesis protein ExoM